MYFRNAAKRNGEAPSDQRQTSHIQVIQQVAADVQVNVSDQRPIPATTTYEQMLSRRQRNQRIVKLAEQHLALTCGGSDQIFSSIQKVSIHNFLS